MTDRLSDLLHDEARTIEVPMPTAGSVISRGRSIRRRRRAGTLGAVAAVVAVAVAAATVRLGTGQDDAVSPADQRAYEDRGAWADGTELHVGRHVVQVPDLDAIAYTSLGVLAWASHRLPVDAPLEDLRATTVLVRPDGDVETLDLPGLDRAARAVPATDPATPYVAYLRPVDSLDSQEIVVADLDQGRVVAVSPEPLERPTALGMAFVGESVVVWADGGPLSFDWRAGELGPWDTGDRAPTLGGSGPGGFLTASMSERWWRVVSPDNEVLLEVRSTARAGESEPHLSPDGRFLAVPTESGTIRVYDVESGSSVDLPGQRLPSEHGWTPSGGLIGTDTGARPAEVDICDPVAGTCVSTGEEVQAELTLVEGADSLPV